jgi:3-hydroxyisobutyrate dehydrogenase-like beta-hydroxyacid dehydrogenase
MAEFDGTGATLAGSPQEASRDADIVALMVATPEQADAALFGPDGAADVLAPGATVVLFSTVGPDAARSLDARLAEIGSRMLDAPVSGGVSRASTGDLLIMASGSSPAVSSVRALLDRLGSNVVIVGDEVGLGQSLKLVNQLLCGVHICAAAEALNLASALGLDPSRSWEAIRTGAAASFMLEDRGRRMLRGEFEPIRSALSIFVKDMGLVLEAARESRTPTPIASAAEQMYLEAALMGLGNCDDSALISLFAPKEAE